MTTLNLTHGIDASAWDDVDFCESVFLFDPVAQLPSPLSFLVWGATLVQQHTYVAGYARLTFADVIGGSLKVWLYTDGGRAFLKSVDGHDIILTRTWGDRPAASHFEYAFDTVLAWPYGFCELAIWAQGQVVFTYDEEACISVDEYTSHPGRYAWTNRSRT